MSRVVFHRLEFHISGESGVKNMYGRLDELEEEFKENRFIRVHQSFLVNLMFVKKVSRYSVLLLTGESIPIPRARYRAVEEKYIAFKGECRCLNILEVYLLLYLRRFVAIYFFRALYIEEIN